MIMNSSVLIVLFSALAVSLGKVDYYWRDYNYKEIPSDAVVAGTDKNGRDIYIGQVYVTNQVYHGIVPAHISYCDPTVYVEMGTVVAHDKYIKILSGPRGHFRWLPTTSADFGDVIEGTTPVIGGHQDTVQDGVADYVYYIGRGVYEGETIVGKVLPSSSEFIIATPDHKTLRLTTFDVLLFTDLELQCSAD